MSEVTTKTYSVRLRDRGQVTIPRPVRDELAAGEGDLLTLLQVDDDLLLLTPRKVRVPDLQARFTEEMEKAGISLADLLEGVARERQAIYSERLRDRRDDDDDDSA